MKTMSAWKLFSALGTMLLSVVSATQVAAAMFDLEGVSTNITDVADLAGYDGVTNSSDGDPAILTFSPASDMTYAGTISGNIRLVKNGNGFLNLSGNNTYTGGTQIDHGRLIASSLTAFGATTGAIMVNSDCNSSGTGLSADVSNKVTCVVFGCAGNFAYPINTSTWTHPERKASGYSGIQYYNVAVTVDGVTLSGKITGGGLSLHFGGLSWVVNPPSVSSGSGLLTISGDIDCGSGVCDFASRAETIKITGKVTTLGIYQNNDTSWPPVWELGGTGNSIGVIDIGGGPTSVRYLTATTRDALGGAMVYTSRPELERSFSVKIAADQTVESFTMRTNGTYAGTSLADSASKHHVVASAPAIVTMLGTANRTNDWCFKDGGVTKAMSLVWNPVDNYTYTCVGHTNTITGSITVSRGSFVVGDFCSFPNIGKISVAEGASFVGETAVEQSLKAVTNIVLGADATLALSNDPFVASVAIEAEPGATIDVAEDITVGTVKVGDKYLSAKDFSAGTYKGLTISGAGKLYVSFSPGGEGTYTWLGGGGDDNITTPGNWQGSAAPDFDNETPFIVFAGGTSAVLDRDVSASGIAFDGVTAFELSASGDNLIKLGAGGISNAPSAAARAVTVSAPVMPLSDQVWQMESNTTFTLSGVLKKYGTLAPTLTFRQDSLTNHTINIIGSSTAEAASDFAGDVVFEETPLGNGRYGTAHVRASGYEPFGPGGTLKLKSQGAGHFNGTREAKLFLSNAVISKAVQYGEYYKVHYCADDNSTNVMSGAFTAYNTWGTTSSTFPPAFYAGANSVLRLSGDMDFGTRNNSDTANLVLGSTATVAADKSTGKIVFDGRITRLPKRLVLGNAVGLELNAAGNAITNLNLRHGDYTTSVVSFGTSYALSNGQAMVTFPTYSLTLVDFDLNGTVQHINGFVSRQNNTSGTSNSRISSSGGAGTLRVSQPSDAVFDGYVATNVTIQMEGAATLTFTNSTAFRAGSTLAVSNGTVAVLYATALNEDVALKLMGGTISIPSGQTVRVGEVYYLDEKGAMMQLRRGLYGPGDATVGAFLAPGSGSIRVTKGESGGLLLIVD